MPAKTSDSIADPADREQVRKDIQRLRQDGGGALSQQGALEVFIAPADAIPGVLHDIGRLREISFREVGEGSGKGLDLDEYDQHYLHLFLWDNDAEKVAGAYRVGRTDLILAEHGPRGLYCSTLFEFEQAFLDHLTPGLELGRSFVAPDYQRSLGALLALWKGLGRFIARDPRYAKLFGPVSISQDYTSISKNLIVRYLREEKRDKSLAAFVHPTNPYREEMPLEISPRLESIEQVSARVAESEPDGKGVPVLLRQYLKLNATLLEFNVDPKFANCLDALVMVDLRSAPTAMLKRYMGRAAYRSFVQETALG
ncbi:MAG: GNAT family N-acetyltransferase [Roseibacillus sp.]